LLQDGKVSLDDDITEYLDFDTKGRTIKIRHLLNHTSGMASYTEIPEFWDLSLRKYGRDTLVRIVEQKDFLFEPGEALIYNNSGYFLLGLIIEKITGMSYEEYLAAQIFNPLGMKNTYYSSNSKVITNKVYGYDYSKDGLIQRPYLDHTWPYAAGSLCSTTEDLFIWMTALHEGEIFSEKFYKLLITPDKLNDGTKLRYAMGFSNYSNFGNQSIGHGGGINGFLSETRYFPETDLYIICLVNTTGPKGAGFFADELTWNILDKQEYKSQELDIDLNSIEGKYSGQARGRVLSLEVSALSNSIVLTSEVEGEVDKDTLRTYLGKNTWVDGNNTFIFTDDELKIDQVSGYYRLRKQ
jgi:CubicO group peptidase (beta-lactamase class C family)